MFENFFFKFRDSLILNKLLPAITFPFFYFYLLLAEILKRIELWKILLKKRDNRTNVLLS